MNQSTFDISEIKEKLIYYVLNALRDESDPSDDRLKEIISEIIGMDSSTAPLPLESKRELALSVFNSLRRLDVIEPLMEDPSITEIMVNGTDAIFTERAGVLSRWDKTFTSKEKLVDIVQRIVARCNRVANESNAIVDARLENGARVSVVMAPVALNGPILTIRRFPDHPITMEDLIRWGSVSRLGVSPVCPCGL